MISGSYRAGLILAVAVILPWSTLVAETVTKSVTGIEDEALPSSSPQSSTTAKQPEDNQGVKTITNNSPEPRKQEISSAIESFTPTEEISADNAVPFPVDI